MEPSRIRAKLLEDHAQLRAKAGGVESLALQVMRGDSELASAVRLKGEELRKQLLAHMRWEDEVLLPRLRTPDSAAQGAADACEMEHRVQREHLDELLSALQDSPEPAQLARALLDFVRGLERDMLMEEARLLAPDVLGDAKPG